MVRGIITTKHILAHPLAMIGAVGLIGYLNILVKCLDNKPHTFVELMFENKKSEKETKKLT